MVNNVIRHAFVSVQPQSSHSLQFLAAFGVNIFEESERGTMIFVKVL